MKLRYLTPLTAIAGAKPQLTGKEREETLTAFEQEMKWSSIQDPRRRERRPAKADRSDHCELSRHANTRVLQH
jgi:hypothetical protein